MDDLNAPPFPASQRTRNAVEEFDLGLHEANLNQRDSLTYRRVEATLPS
ncbi:MAG: hypothetical protein ACON4H_07965 [Rubripirellula sp.]